MDVREAIVKIRHWRNSPTVAVFRYGDDIKLMSTNTGKFKRMCEDNIDHLCGVYTTGNTFDSKRFEEDVCCTRKST